MKLVFHFAVIIHTVDRAGVFDVSVLWSCSCCFFDGQCLIHVDLPIVVFCSLSFMRSAGDRSGGTWSCLTSSLCCLHCCIVKCFVILVSW